MTAAQNQGKTYPNQRRSLRRDGGQTASNNLWRKKMQMKSKLGLYEIVPDYDQTRKYKWANFDM